MLNKYIDNLMQNIPIPEKPYELDLVLEGGIFNGSYEMGILMFLKKLENTGVITINRFSGCSIGAVAALKYLLNKMESYIGEWDKFREQFKQNFTLNILKDIIHRDTQSISDKLFKKIRKNKLYINYYDAQAKSQIVQSVFKNREEIRDAILKSCHIPYVINGQCYAEEKERQFLDGGFPYIFPERYSSCGKKHILYISISHISKIKNMIRTPNEKSIYGRALEGMLDVYNFFLKGKPTIMCSFVDQWTLFDFTILRIKQSIILISIYWLYICKKIVNRLQPFATKIKLYHELKPLWKEMYRDWLLYICFR